MASLNASQPNIAGGPAVFGRRNTARSARMCLYGGEGSRTRLSFARFRLDYSVDRSELGRYAGTDDRWDGGTNVNWCDRCCLDGSTAGHLDPWRQAVRLR